jgi:hypothetical protein
MPEDVLSPEMITALLASKRVRGGHEQFVRKFVAQHTVYYWKVNDDLAYQAKTKEQLETSVKQGLETVVKKLHQPDPTTGLMPTINGNPVPEIKLVMNGDDLLIVDMVMMAAELEARKAAEAA